MFICKKSKYVTTVTNNRKSTKNEELNKKLDMCLEIIQNEVIPQMNVSGNIYNTNTNTFNLNVFLNETCKDAINMSEFINNLKIELKDLEFTKTNGVINGISNIFVNGLNALKLINAQFIVLIQKGKRCILKTKINGQRIITKL